MRSSYIENNYGLLFKNYVIGFRPVSFVELGVLDGYSTLHIAKGIKELKRLYNIDAKLDAYDLFEDYQFNHGSQEEVQQMLEKEKVGGYVNLIKASAYEVASNYTDKSIEFLHVDISNTGEVINKIMEIWHPKIRERGIVILEGGSEERDKVEWMTKYNMPSLKKGIETNPTINKYYMYGTYMDFPSVTVLMRIWWDAA